MSQRKAATKKKALAYKSANCKEKSRILDEIVGDILASFSSNFP